MKSFRWFLNELTEEDSNPPSGSDVMCSVCTGTGKTDQYSTDDNTCFACNGKGKYFVYSQDK